MFLFILITGIYLTFRTYFFHVTHSRQIFSTTFGSIFQVTPHTATSSESTSISPFQALCTALAGTMGVGNIAGVAAAIVSGGPGAVFWMWVSAFFGMMTHYCEIVLGIHYRRKNADGEWCSIHIICLGTDTILRSRLPNRHLSALLMRQKPGLNTSMK